MTRNNLRFILAFCLGLTVFFQNCSSNQNQFFDDQLDSEAPSLVTLEGGGDGYDGKFFDLVSESEQCQNPQDPVSRIYIDANNQAFLMITNCQALAQPQAISVQATDDPNVIGYNGQFFQNITSNYLYNPISKATVVGRFEVENMTPPSGQRQQQWDRYSGYGFLLGNSAFSETISLSEAGDYWFVVNAKAQRTIEKDAGLEVRVNGEVLGLVYANDVAGEFWFEAKNLEGDCEVELAFVNDTNDPDNNVKLNIALDYLIVAKQPAE